MRMMDCFYEVFYKTLTYVEEFKKGTLHDYEAVRLVIDRTLVENASGYLEGGYSEEHYRLALYAVVAFIDEAMMLSGWEHKNQWKKDMLQMRHFQSINAGEAFYEKLQALSAFDPSERDIREVYYYALTLGFRGKYYKTEDQTILANLRKNNLELLKDVNTSRQANWTARPKGRSSVARQRRFFPEAYLPGREGAGVMLHIDYRPFAYGIPIVVFLILFYLLRLEIYNAANYLVTTL